MSAHKPAPSSPTSTPHRVPSVGPAATRTRHIKRPALETEVPAWWQGLMEAEESLSSVESRKNSSTADEMLLSRSEVDGGEREVSAAVAAPVAITFDLGSSPPPQVDRFGLYAQASKSESDAPASVNVSKMPPWSVALLGLLGGGALVALASGGDDFRVLNINWTTTQSATAEPNTRLVAEASRLEGVDPPHVLTLTGAGEVQVLGWKADGVVKADNLLTGTLFVETADDDQADLWMKIVTGRSDTTVQLRDASDVVHIDAAKLAATARLVVKGEVGRLIVSNLTGVLDATGLKGETEIFTTALPNGHPQLKSLQLTNPLVSILTGESSTSVTSGRAEEIVAVNAAQLDTVSDLNTSGQGRFIVTNFADADLFNQAAGGLDVTLGKPDAVLGRVTIFSSTDARVYNGTMRDGDQINLIDLGSSTPVYVVSGLRADLDAGMTSGSIEVTTADAGDNRISVDSGKGDLRLSAVGASDLISINASQMIYPSEIILQGPGSVEVTDLAAAVDAKTLTGALSVSSSSASAQTIYVEAGTANTEVRVNNAAANAVIDALAMVTGSKLTTGGDGSVQVSGLGVDLVNSAKNGSVVTARRQDVAGNFALKITSTSSLVVNNGSLDRFDVLTLDGSGANSSPDFRVVGLLADLDAASTTGALEVSTARRELDNSIIDITTGQGDTQVATPVAGTNDVLADFQGDSVTIDATRLDKLGGRLSLSGDSSILVMMSASVSQGYYELVSTTDFELDAAATVLAGDSINLQVSGVNAAKTITISESPNRFEIRGLVANLDADKLTKTTAIVDVSLFDTDFNPAASGQSLEYGGSVKTGAGNDHLRFEHAFVPSGGGAAFVPITPGPSSTFDLGGGHNEVHVGKGVTPGAAFDLRSASFVASNGNGGTLGLVISDDGKVHVSSAHLQVMTSGAAVFSDFREAMDGVNFGLDLSEEALFSRETLIVDTKPDANLPVRALGAEGRPSYLLDAAIERWEIGVQDGGDNRVLLGESGQSVRFGAGQDSVDLNRRSAGDLIGVERIIVGGAGSSIADAAVTSDESNTLAIGVGQLSAGVVIDFENGANRLLRVTADQHRTLADGFSSFANVSGPGQGLSLKNGTIDLEPGALLVPNVTGLPGIEGYALGDSSLVNATGHVRVNPFVLFDGISYARDYGGLEDIYAINDFSQGASSFYIQGGLGNDVIRTSGDDATRGMLEVDLSKGGRDLVYVNNISWNNEIRFGEPVPSISGTDAAIFSGFSAGVASPDLIAMISNNGEVMRPEMIYKDKKIGQSDAPITPDSVVEFSADFSGGLNVNDPQDLEGVAVFINEAIGQKAQNGSYYFIIYEDNSPVADAWLYAGLAQGATGFNYGQAGSTDTLELIAIFSDVGANSFSSANLAWFGAPQLVLLPS